MERKAKLRETEEQIPLLRRAEVARPRSVKSAVLNSLSSPGTHQFTSASALVPNG